MRLWIEVTRDHDIPIIGEEISTMAIVGLVYVFCIGDGESKEKDEMENFHISFWA